MDKIQTLRPNDRMREMVTAIQKEKGLKTLSDVYFYCIGEVYHKLFPIYVGKRGLGDSRDPEEVARNTVAIKEAERKEKEKIALAENKNICVVSLNGEVVDMPDGQYCEFNTYQFDTPDLQRVPLELCTPDFAKHQKVKPKNKK